MILTHRHTILVWLAAIALFLFLASCPPAVGYEVCEFKWDTADFPVKYWIDPAIEAGGEGVIAMDTIERAFQRWSEVASSCFDVEYQGIKTGVNASDGECHVMLFYDEGDVFAPPLAKTYYHSSNGRLIDADIAFNTWYQLTEESWWRTALHEIGHLAGLDHSTSRYAIMDPTSDPSRSDLGADDIEGITFLYPAAGLCDLIPLRMLYPLYASPTSVGPLAAEIQNVGDPIGATVETTIYVSDSADFSGVSAYIGRESVYLDTLDPVTVRFPVRAFGQAGPLFFGLAVDTANTAFESDEDNNLKVVEIPIREWEANGDDDLDGIVGPLDLFEFCLHWKEDYLLPRKYRFDFGQSYKIREEDLLEFLRRWHNNTLPTKKGTDLFCIMESSSDAEKLNQK